MHKVTFALLVIGGLNWLLLGLFSWEVGALFGGSGAIISRIIYLLIGLSAIYEIVAHKKLCKECVVGSKPAASSAPASSAPTA